MILKYALADSACNRAGTKVSIDTFVPALATVAQQFSEQSCAQIYCTVRETVAVCAMAPEVPVTVIVSLPAVVPGVEVGLQISVSVAALPPLHLNADCAPPRRIASDDSQYPC